MCYSCRKKIDCKTEMRITTNAIYNLKFPEIRTKSFHVDAACLKDWKYHDQQGSLVNTLPVFSEKVAISPAIYQSKLDQQYQKQLNDLNTNGIELTSQTPFNTFGRLEGIVTHVYLLFCLLDLLFMNPTKVREGGHYIAQLMSEFGLKVNVQKCDDPQVSEYISKFVHQV